MIAAILFIILILTTLTGGALLFSYRRQLKELRVAFMKLSQSFDDLDEQAKLIVKTDLDLNKAQEELDKRLNGLDALQKLSRAINTTLDESEIFSILSKNLLGHLGFEKYLFFLITDSRFETKRIFGFTEDNNQKLQKFLTIHENPFMKKLRSGESVSSQDLAADIKIELSNILGIKNFILAPIIAQGRMLGLTVSGNNSAPYFFTEGDVEIISILTGQLGQAIENARLFEQLYRSRQDLERKVQERTKQLTEALINVQQINKKKSDFISAVSHELRTPLTSIKGYASILIAGKMGEIPLPVKERLEKINKHSDSLVALVNNLLDISRIESGKAELKFQFYPLKMLVDNIADLLAPQFKEKGLYFQNHIPQNLPDVCIDSSQIERVFINLMGNAVKFTPAKGVITVSAVAHENYILASVSDTGIGLKDDEQKKLFSEFFRADNEINQNVKGTGLGLSLTKRIIEAHKGQIFIKSKFGQGTTFSFSLPTSSISEPITHEKTIDPDN